MLLKINKSPLMLLILPLFFSLNLDFYFLLLPIITHAHRPFWYSSSSNSSEQHTFTHLKSAQRPAYRWVLATILTTHLLRISPADRAPPPNKPAVTISSRHTNSLSHRIVLLQVALNHTGTLSLSCPFATLSRLRLAIIDFMHTDHPNRISSHF